MSDIQSGVERLVTAGRAIPGPVTTVIDAGARYGMHPSWSRFEAELQYLAFEPDPQEAARLKARPQHPGYRVFDVALARESGERSLYIAAHRGNCSFLKMNADADWKCFRPAWAKVESTIVVKTCSIDEFAEREDIQVDFLKLDTEGTEFEVLQGAQAQLQSSILGIRCSVGFQPSYHEEALFPEIHRHLLSNNFFLLNLDYFGRGVPRNCLFRRPNPLSEDTIRYGTLLGTDGVWIKSYEKICEEHQDNQALALATLKYAYFCLLNHAPDVAIDTLLAFRRRETFAPPLTDSLLYKRLRYACAELLGQWRVCPDAQWDTIRSMFSTIFGMELVGGSEYWEFIQGL